MTAVLTETQVLEFALGAGFTRPEADTMVAIAHFESGWNPNNIGDQTLSRYGSIGLWQIFTGVHDPNEVLGSGGSTWTPALVDELKDPAKNAHAAHVVFKEQGFTAWSTYNNYHTTPTFQGLVTSAGKIVVPSPGPSPVPVPTPVPAPVTSASEALQHAEAEVGKGGFHNECLIFVREQYGLAADGREPTAAAAWNDCPADKRHASHDGKTAPAGVPFVFSGGASGAGHIVIMLGDNKGGCISSDWPNDDGKVGETTVDAILAKWTDLHPEGWLEELEGHVVYAVAPAPTTPPVPGPNGDPGTWHNFPGTEAFRIGHSNPAVWILGVRLEAAGFAKHKALGRVVYSPSHVFALHDLLNVKDFQKSLGWSGNGADGYPGALTWVKLGEASNWRVA